MPDQVPPGPGRYIPPQDQAGTPPQTKQVRPPRPGRYTPGPGRYTPLGPGRYTPWGPGQPTPRQQIPAYGKRAGGTHPTGMHSCWKLLLEMSNTSNKLKIKIVLIDTPGFGSVSAFSSSFYHCNLWMKKRKRN